MEISRSHW